MTKQNFNHPCFYSDRPIPIEWDSFFKGEIVPKYDKDKLISMQSFIPIAAIALSQNIPSNNSYVSVASKSLTPAEAIERASKPIEDMVLAIAKPVTKISAIWGSIELITGHSANGIQRIKFALLGFVSIKWLRLLVDAVDY